MQTSCLNLNQTHAHVDNRVYLLFGDEPMLQKQSLFFITKNAKAQGFDSQMRYEIDRFFDWHLLFQELQAQSLFAQKRIIKCQLSYLKDAIKHFPKLLENIPEDVILVLVIDSLTPAQKKSKWFSNIDKKGVVISHYSLNHIQTKNWLIARLSGLKLTLDAQTIDALLHNNEGNLLAMWQELQKLKLTYLDCKIDNTLYQSHLEQQSHYKPYQLVDTALSGNVKQTLKIYYRLQAEGLEAMYLVNLLAKEIKTLTNISLNARTVGVKKAVSEYRFWGEKPRIIEAVVQKNSTAQLQKMLLTIGQLERSSKGRGQYDTKTIWHGLLSLLITLSGHKTWMI